MKAIVCLDDRGGMTFGGRRQSRDRALCEDIVRDLDIGQRLLMCEYSKNLFESYAERVNVCDGFLDLAQSSDVCFVENKALLPYIDKIDSLVIYRWNRHYPSDTCFDLDLEASGFGLVSSCEFVGSSHEKITKEIYVR